VINSKDVGIFVVFILVFSLLSMFSVGGDVAIQGTENEVMQLSGLRYTTHDPIYIDSDANFTAANGVSGGDGSKANPYIISGYEIDVKGGYYGIVISNTHSYFTIKDCYIYNTTTFGWFMRSAGINFYNLTNGSIVSSVIMNNGYGILVEDSSNIWIKNNTISHNFDDGIFFNSVNESILSNNTLMDNYKGIYLLSSYRNVMYENKITNNSIMLLNDRDTLLTQTIYTNNTVNGKPVYYYKNANMNNASVPTDAGEVLVGNVSYLKVENLNIEHVDIAMEVTYSEYVSIENNSISNNMYGIWCFTIENSTLANNTIKNHTQDGVIVDTVNYTDIRDNKFEGSGRYGLQVFALSNSSIENNIFIKNDASGLNVYYSQYNYVNNNNASDNWRGIVMYQSHHNFISNSTLINNSGDALSFKYSNNNYIENNTVEYNDGYGIYLIDSAYNEIRSNRMTENGIILGGNFETFTTQIMDSNMANGKPIYYYKNVDASNSAVPTNAGQIILGNVSHIYLKNVDIKKVDVGIDVGYSNHIYVENNNLGDNQESGLWIYYSENVSVKENIMSGNMYGIRMANSDYNSIVDNTIENSKNIGMYIYNSYNNTVSGNTIEENGLDGILLSSSNYNIITNNEISNNTGYGIYINAYSNNLIYNNAFYFNNGSSGVYSKSHIQAYDSGHNIWNTTDVGNYWHDWANNNNTNDQNSDGIVDWPYKLDGGAVDYRPLKSADIPIPELSMVVLVVLVLFAALLLRKRV